MTRRIVDLTGQKFDLLKAVSYAGIAKNGGTNWLCECECGKTKIMSGSYLKRKDRYKSCGCKSKNASDWAKELNTSHTTVKRWAALGKFGKIVNAPNANVDG